MSGQHCNLVSRVLSFSLNNAKFFNLSKGTYIVGYNRSPLPFILFPVLNRLLVMGIPALVKINQVVDHPIGTDQVRKDSEGDDV